MSQIVLVFARIVERDALKKIVLPLGCTMFVDVRGVAEALIVAEPPTTRDALAGASSPGLEITSFARCRTTGAMPAPTELRAPRGLLLGATDCGDPNAEGEFHAFYDGIHAREVLESKLYWRARRFEVVEHDPRDAFPRFFALYDTEMAGADAYRALRKFPMTPPAEWPKCFVVRNVASFDAISP